MVRNAEPAADERQNPLHFVAAYSRRRRLYRGRAAALPPNGSEATRARPRLQRWPVLRDRTQHYVGETYLAVSEGRQYRAELDIHLLRPGARLSLVCWASQARRGRGKHGHTDGGRRPIGLQNG